MENFAFFNIYICLIGWVAWNVGLFSFAKDDSDDIGKPFSVKAYVVEHWDNWLASLFAIPVLLVVGFYQWNLNALAQLGDAGKWENLYYLGSGFFTEAAKYSYKKWRKSKQ
jgi:hypothetical protein